MAKLSNEERGRIEQALRRLETICQEHAHERLPNLVLPVVDEIRKVLDLDSDT